MGYTNLTHIFMVYTLRWETTAKPLADPRLNCLPSFFNLINRTVTETADVCTHNRMQMGFVLCYDYCLEMLLDVCSLCTAVKKGGVGCCTQSRRLRIKFLLQ